MNNEKQIALETIRFGNPGRVLPALPKFSAEYIGVNHDGFDDCMDEHLRPVGSRWTDIWGTRWHKEYPDLMGLPCGCPLEGPEALEEYRWPDPDDPRIVASIRRCRQDFAAQSLEDQQFLCGSHRDTLWEKAYMLVGMEPMMEYFYIEPEFAREVLRRIMDFQLGIARHYADIGVEMVDMSDDMGTQSSLLLGMGIFKEFLLPEYRRLLDFYKSRGVLVNFHSCGHIEPLLETFIEMGVDILNPVQVTANDLGRVAAAVKGRMAILGGVSSVVLMAGDRDAIFTEVKKSLDIFSSGGGYFCAPDQYMPYPAQSLAWWREAVDLYGRRSPKNG